MTSTVNQELYQQMILDHNKKPRNFGSLEECTHQAEGINPLCGDHYHVFMRLDADGVIEEVKFEGDGCAISKASGSMMTMILKGKKKEEALEVFELFHSLLVGKLEASEEAVMPAKLKIFSGIWKYPSRVKCASLSWHAMKNALTNGSTAITE